MSAGHGGKNKLLEWVGYIIVLAIVYEFLFSRTGLFFQRTIQEKTGVDSATYISKSYKQDATSVKNFLDSVNIFNKTPESLDLTSTLAAFESGYVVTKVVDGDTIDIVGHGKEERVRLIGINTPETVDPRRPVQCYGKEASDYMKKLASAQEVYIELDPSQSKYDKNSRLLAYVYVSSGEMLNRKMIQDGYAYEYTYDNPYKYQIEFKNLQSLAKQNSVGLWSTSTCSGQM